MGTTLKASWDVKTIMSELFYDLSHFDGSFAVDVYTGKNASSFRWDRYLQQCGGQTVPKSAFTSAQKK